MREILLIGIVAVACFLTLITPEIGILSYIGYSLLRPDVLAYSKLSFSLVIAATVLVSSLRMFFRIGNLFNNPFSVLLLTFQLLIGVSVLTAVNTSLSVDPWFNYIRVIIMALLIPILIVDEVWLRRLVLVFGVSVGLVGAKFAATSVMGGGVFYSTGFGGLMKDSNGLALGLAMALPICWYARALVRPAWAKLALLGLTGTCGLTIVMTQSRGNSVAAAVVLLTLVLRAKQKLANLMLAAVLLLPGLFLAGNLYIERMKTLADVESEASANSRIEFAKAALGVIGAYPLLGVGWGELNYIQVSSSFLGRENMSVVHNTYLQVGADSGIPALACYAAMLFGAILWLERSIRRMRRVSPQHEVYPRALQAALLAFAVGSTFYSRGEFEFMYMLLMTTAAWYQIESRVVAAAAATAPALPLPQPLAQPWKAPAARPPRGSTGGLLRPRAHSGPE